MMPRFAGLALRAFGGPARLWRSVEFRVQKQVLAKASGE